MSAASERSADSTRVGWVAVHFPPSAAHPGAAKTLVLSIAAIVVGFLIGASHDAFVPIHGIVGALIALAVMTRALSWIHRWSRAGRWHLHDGPEDAMAAARRYLRATDGASRATGFRLEADGRWWAIATPSDERASLLLLAEGRDAAARALAALGVQDGVSIRLPVRHGRLRSLPEIGLLASIGVYLFGESLPDWLFRGNPTLADVVVWYLPVASILAVLLRPLFNTTAMIEVHRGTTSLLSWGLSAGLAGRAYVEGIPRVHRGRALLTLRGTERASVQGTARVSLFGGSLTPAQQLRFFSAVAATSQAARRTGEEPAEPGAA